MGAHRYWITNHRAHMQLTSAPYSNVTLERAKTLVNEWPLGEFSHICLWNSLSFICYDKKGPTCFSIYMTNAMIYLHQHVLSVPQRQVFHNVCVCVIVQFKHKFMYTLIRSSTLNYIHIYSYIFKKFPSSFEISYLIIVIL